MDFSPDFPLARYIDQTRLGPNMIPSAAASAAREAVKAGFAAFCAPPYLIRDLAAMFRGSDTVLQTVIGFPLGFHTVDAKVFEARQAVSDGARELDLVINRAWVKASLADRVTREVAAVVEAAGAASVKAILEISDLSREEVLAAALAAVKGGAAFIKTSTGFSASGAEVDTVRALKDELGGRAGIKASGGIRTLGQALEFIRAGADRLGTSSGLEILAAFKGSTGA